MFHSRTAWSGAKYSKAIAIIRGKIGKSRISGTIKFQQNSQKAPVIIDINVRGFPIEKASAKHGMHVHEWGLRNSSAFPIVCDTAGAHFNPFKNNHGDISFKERHFGDYGNVIASPRGLIKTRLRDRVSKLYGPNSIIGRTIIIHRDRDDLGLLESELSKTVGTSGPRVACGIIAIDKKD